jgi:hypothetical protein
VSKIEFGECERDKQDRQYVDMFEREVAPKYLKKKAPRKIDVATEAVGTLKYICSVPTERLAEYGLEPPEWELAEGDEHGIWQRVSTGAYELRRPSPTAYTPRRRAAPNRHERVARVNAEVYFEHLPGGPRTFKNAREAREYVQREHDLDLNM